MPDVRRTTCSRDCPDACGILATVVDGKVVALKGDPEHPVTRGFLCYRTSRFVDLQNSPARVRTPLLRRGHGFEPISWDAALDLVAEKLRAIRAASGPAAIFHYRSGGSLGLLKPLADRFFDLFGPCTGKVGDICSGAGEAAQIQDLGVSDSNDLFDLLHARHILLWGKNPTVSNVHLVPVLDEARARGTKLTLIDPVRHQTAARVDRVVTPRPGRDLELALGVGRALFDRGAVHPLAPERCNGLEGFRELVHRHSVAGWGEQAGVECAYIQGLAEALADGPTAILVGWGMQRRLRGGAIVRALDALSAVSGNLYVSGGGCSFYFRRRKPFADLAPPVAHPRVVREPLMAQDLTELRDPPIRMMWVTAGNPVAMLPDSAGVARALEQLEFLVVADPFLTDTARRAHLVLPVPTLLEDDDVIGSYGHHWVGESRPVVAAPEGIPHEIEIFQRLADRLGLGGYPRGSIDELKRMALAPSERKGLSLERLREHGQARSPLADKLLFAQGKVATPSGRVELLDVAPPPPELPSPPAVPGASGVLWLFSNSTSRSQASVWSGPGLGERVWIAVHPSALPGVEPGATVLVESVHGMLTAELRHDAALQTDVAVMPKGGSFDRGQGANALVPARATDLGLGAAYLDVLVRIRPAGDAAGNGAAR